MAIAHAGKTLGTDDAADVFGEVISAYTRGQAIDDGVLVAVPRVTSREAGLTWPVALTRTAWERYVTVPRGVAGQDEAGRLWDVLSMLSHAIRSGRLRGREGLFQLHVRNDNREHTPPLRTLKAVSGPDDAGAPCLTVMLPEED